MTTSQTRLLSEILSDGTITSGKLAYFRRRLRNRIHSLVLAEFMRLDKAGVINRANLARRIGKRPEQVTRWLGSPGNWTLDTFSDLLLAMKCEPAFTVSSLANLRPVEGWISEATKQSTKQTTGLTEAVFGTTTAGETVNGTSGLIMVPKQPTPQRVQYVTA